MICLNVSKCTNKTFISENSVLKIAIRNETEIFMVTIVLLLFLLAVDDDVENENDVEVDDNDRSVNNSHNKMVKRK